MSLRDISQEIHAVSHCVIAVKEMRTRMFAMNAQDIYCPTAILKSEFAGNHVSQKCPDVQLYTSGKCKTNPTAMNRCQT